MRVVLALFSAIILSYSFASSKRVLSTLPSFTESMYYLGAEDLLVGVSDYCNYPSEVRKLPRYGTAFEINLEKLIKDKIDTVLLADIKGSRVRDNLNKLGIKTIVAPYKDLDDAVKMLQVLNSELKLEQTKKIKKLLK